MQSQIRREVLLELMGELYQWLEEKLGAEPEEEPRCTNHYLCQKDSTRWDARWSCQANDRCPTCDAVVEPYATGNSDGSETVYDEALYRRANVLT